MGTTRNWPSREEWARNMRTVFADMENPRPASTRLSDYATPKEIEASITAVKAMLTAARREELAYERSLGRKPGESRPAFRRRFMHLPGEEKNALIDAALPFSPSIWPRQIRNILKELRDGFVSGRILLYMPAPPSPLDAILARYQVAAAAANARWYAEVEATPIDDVAWEQELERRRKIEERRGYPERFIHRAL